MREMRDNCIDLTVTSPPYDNLRTYTGESKWTFELFQDIAKELYRITKPGGVVVWVVGDATINGSETGTSFKQALWFIECGFKLHDTMIYQKNSAPQNNKRYQPQFEYMFVLVKGKIKTFNAIKENCKKYGTHHTAGHRNKDGTIKQRNTHVKKNKVKSNIWFYYAGNGEGDKIAQLHSARFPEQLAKDHIISWSNEGDIVFDPFMGSGTTGKMALKNNRQFIGVEISKKYYEIAKRRIYNQ